MGSGLFITGTNTDVGKTFVSALLLAGASAQGLNVRYFKPVQIGTESDCDNVKSLLGCDASRLLNPALTLSLPLSTHLRNHAVELPDFRRVLTTNPAKSFIVEGAGGLLVPLAKNFLIRDLVKSLELPLIIVAATTLGTINHTLLTIEAANAANITIAGVILSGERDPDLAHCIETLTSIKVIAEIPWISDKTPAYFKTFGKKLFNNPAIKKHFIHATQQSHIS